MMWRTKYRELGGLIRLKVFDRYRVVEMRELVEIMICETFFLPSNYFTTTISKSQKYP